MEIKINAGCTAYQGGGFTERLPAANDNNRELGELACAINDMFRWDFGDGDETPAAAEGAADLDEDVPAERATILSWPIVPRRPPEW